MEMEGSAKFFAYVGCTLAVALAATTPALMMAVYGCVALMFEMP